MDVTFKNSLCNCQPSKIDDYGKYEWEDPYQLLDIPKLPDDLYELVRTPPPSPLLPPPPLEVDEAEPTADLKDLKALCC